MTSGDSIFKPKFYNNQEIAKLKGAQLRRWRARRAMIFQRYTPWIRPVPTRTVSSACLNGRVVFDGPPEELSDDLVLDIYGVEGRQELDVCITSTTISAQCFNVVTVSTSRPNPAAVAITPEGTIAYMLNSGERRFWPARHRG